MRRNLSRIVAVAAALCSLCLVSTLRVQAQTDPATLHIGPGAGTSCATGCAFDPNLVGSGNIVDVYQNSGGASLQQPAFLILGIPNNTSNLFTSDPITGVTFTSPYPGGTVTSGSSAFATGGTYGLTSPSVDGFFGTMTAGDVYSFLSINGDSSNSFVNWSGADLAHDSITATGFGIYVFALSGASLNGNVLANVTFASGSLPLGTFAVGYGCKSGGSTTNCSQGDSFSTPFTEAGLTDAKVSVAPEPGSMVLFGIGLLAIGFVLTRRWAGSRAPQP